MPDFVPDWRSDLSRLEPFSRIQLIALDVDGTLLERTKSALARTVTDLKNALQHVAGSVKLTLSTGRALQGTLALTEELNPLRDVPAIVYNGSLIAFPRSRRSLYHRQITNADVKTVFRIARQFKLTATAYTIGDLKLAAQPDPIEEVAYGLDSDSAGLDFREFNGLPVRWIQDPDSFPDTVTTAMLLDLCDRTAPITLFENLDSVHGISVTTSGNRYLEIRPQGSNKGEALRLLSAHLGVEQANVLALGDNDNDAEMLKWAGIGIAVETSTDAARSNADYISRHGPMSAAIEVLRCVKAARRYSKGLPSAHWSHT